MSKLDRDRILEHAMATIVADGEPALAMRPLAASLGVTPMALYRHFADRDALLLALVERVSEEIDFPEAVHGQDDPAARAVELARCLHGFLVAHPWMVRLIATGRLASPAGLRFPEGFLACARDAGLGDVEAFLFYRTLFAAVLGQATMTIARGASKGRTAPGRQAFSAAPPIVSSLAERWAELDAEASPSSVFRTLAETLVSR